MGMFGIVIQCFGLQRNLPAESHPGTLLQMVLFLSSGQETKAECSAPPLMAAMAFCLG